MTMIEKVAIAIRDSFNSNDIDCGPIAKAAIEAMREPSDAMIADFDRSPTLRKAAVDSYQAMIDAALKE